MGYRISKIYTRTGDDGTTSMTDGSRIAKDAPIIHAAGDVDELNACIGVLRAEDLPDLLDKALEYIQHELFALGGELALPEYQIIAVKHVEKLEVQIDTWNSQLHPLKEFILPMGNRPVTLCHQARTVCRRVERTLTSYAREQELRVEIRQYINRLSDFLFVAARMLAADKDLEEILWEQKPR